MERTGRLVFLGCKVHWLTAIGAKGPEMRKLAVGTFLTLDGVMQAPGGPEEDPSGRFRSWWVVGELLGR